MRVWKAGERPVIRHDVAYELTAVNDGFHRCIGTLKADDTFKVSVGFNRFSGSAAFKELAKHFSS